MSTTVPQQLIQQSNIVPIHDKPQFLGHATTPLIEKMYLGDFYNRWLKLPDIESKLILKESVFASKSIFGNEKQTLKIELPNHNKTYIDIVRANFIIITHCAIFSFTTQAGDLILSPSPTIKICETRCKDAVLWTLRDLKIENIANKSSFNVVVAVNPKFSLSLDSVLKANLLPVHSS